MIILELNWFFFTALTVLLYWQFPVKARDWWIVAVSAGFLAALSPISLLILCVMTALIYMLTNGTARISGQRLILLIIGCGTILSFYKLRAEFMPPAIDLDPLAEKFIIPLGLSYYAFRCIHYGIEKYKGTIPIHPFADFIKYIFFLPTFMAGPIHRFHDFQRDIRRKRWDGVMFTAGLERILFGYVKITFINGLLVNYYFNLYTHYHLPAEWVYLRAYCDIIKNTASLYFQFSGYSDVAIGLGMLFGYKVMENFNFPYLAKNISEFWTRWHISLTSWCKDYVYIGTIAVSRSPILAAFAAMMVMGLWHEFSVRFILWGLYHGAGIMLWQQFQKLKPRLPQTDNKAALACWHGFCRFLTLHYFMGGVLIATAQFDHDVFGNMLFRI